MIPWVKIKAWLKKWWKWVATGVAILSILLFGIAYRRNLEKQKIQQHKIKILKAKNAVERLEGRREVVRERQDVVAGEIEALDGEIAQLDEVIKHSRSEVERLTAKEKLARFKKLGYGGEE
jgi:hypothetical protein